MLRDRRVELGHSIETVAAQTHIKIGYLKAIEEGRRRDLPGAAYTIGFVRTYADFLGFDGNRLVTDFHAQLAGTRTRATPEQTAQAAPVLPRLTISPVMIAGAALVVVLVGFFLWGYLSDGTGSTESMEEAQDVAESDTADTADAQGAGDAEPAATEDAAVGAATGETAATQNAAVASTPEPAAGDEQAATAPIEDQVPPESETADAAEQSPAEVQEATAEEGAGTGKVVLRAKLESWVQITNAKGEPILSRVLRSGETYTVPNEKGLMLTTGNAGGIEILLDGKKLKSLGSVGLVRRDIALDPKKLKDGSAFKPAASTQSGQ